VARSGFGCGKDLEEKWLITRHSVFQLPEHFGQDWPVGFAENTGPKIAIELEVLPRVACVFYPLRQVIGMVKVGWGEMTVRRFEAEELHSIGLSGLVVAAQRYQPSQRETFPGYAATRIRGAILDELRRQDPMSRYSRGKAKRLGSAISKLQQEQGPNYSRDSLRAEMNMSEEELAGLMEEVRPMRLVSLDEVDSADHPCTRSSMTIATFRLPVGFFLVCPRRTPNAISV
jgi:RNA polymerase sigma factor (sigma-70 family)